MSRPLLTLLSGAEAEEIAGRACRALETIGVRVEGAEGERLLLEAGGERRNGRVLIPERSVRAALATAPRALTLFDRDGQPAAELHGTQVSFDPGSAALHVLDPATSRRRPAITSDLVSLARLVDALPGYAVQSTALVASDVPDSIADRHRLHVALREGRKPVVTGVFSTGGFAPMLAQLQAVRGGEAALRAKPLAIFDCCPTSPLTWSELTASCLAACARAGVPANLISVPLLGATAPVTLREAAVQHCAENLSGLVLHQAAAPGAPVVFGGAPAAFDMRRGTAVMSAPESLLAGAAYAQVGRHLGLPTHAYLGLSDAKLPDYQAGLESGAGALVAALAGVNLASGPGLLDYLLTQSLPKLLLDHEACLLALRISRGLETREGDALALLSDLVATGSLLSHPHTRRHWRAELGVASPLLDRDGHGDWLAAGARDAAERARAEVERRLAAPAAPLPAEVAAELEAILAAELRAAGVPA